MVPNVAFVTSTAISYNSLGSFKTIASNYKDLFVHSQVNDCIVTSCTLMIEGCSNSLPFQSNVVIEDSPTFALKAKETNPSGYLLNFCV